MSKDDDLTLFCSICGTTIINIYNSSKRYEAYTILNGSIYCWLCWKEQFPDIKPRI